MGKQKLTREVVSYSRKLGESYIVYGELVSTILADGIGQSPFIVLLIAWGRLRIWSSMIRPQVKQIMPNIGDGKGPSLIRREKSSSS